MRIRCRFSHDIVRVKFLDSAREYFLVIKLYHKIAQNYNMYWYAKTV